MSQEYCILNLLNIEDWYHHNTHIDFLIYNKISKIPLLVVEVDGYKYHQTFLFYKNFVSNLYFCLQYLVNLVYNILVTWFKTFFLCFLFKFIISKNWFKSCTFLLNKISGYFLTPAKYYRTVFLYQNIILEYYNNIPITV